MIAERLAHFAVHFELAAATQEDIEYASWLVADTIGCAMGAAREPKASTIDILRNYAWTDRSRPEATVIGTNWKSSLRSVSMVNCALARYLDANDIYVPVSGSLSGSGHFSDAIPALLAVAERERTTGAAFLEAVIVAYDVQASLADAFPWLDRGFHSVSQVTVAVALAGGRLLGLDAASLAHASALAITSGLFVQSWLRPGTEVAAIKGGAPGLAAERGILCAELAAGGFTAPLDAFETFFDEFSDSIDDPETAMSSLGNVHRIRRNAIKPVPAQIYTQAVIQCVLKLHEAELRLSDLDRLTVYSNDGACGRVQGSPGAYRPGSREAADHSTPFVAVMALRDGRLSPATYRDEPWSDPIVIDAMRRISLVIDDGWSERLESQGVLGASVKATTLAGKSYQARVEQFRGHPVNPLSRDELGAKLNAFIGTADAGEQDAGMMLLKRCEELPEALNIDSIVQIWHDPRQ